VRNPKKGRARAGRVPSFPGVVNAVGLGSPRSPPVRRRLARRRAPEGKFHVGSVLAADLSPCIAVAAIGEIVNYMFDPCNSASVLVAFFRRVYQALQPGGVLLFDTAVPARVLGGSLRQVRAEGDGWAVREA
jgi:hypothetical protein